MREDGELDLDHLTEEQARWHQKAVVFYRTKFGFEIETLTKLLDVGLDPYTVIDDAIELNRLAALQRRGIWFPTPQIVED